MPLLPGARLGAYEIAGLIGAGGMGEVYRARDTRLNRDVALKILPDSFAADPERVARFTREAQILASLNHPHIAAIYGIEEAAAARFLVLELVEGGTLDQKSGRSFPLEDALAIARQIADALEAAHEKGVIHRDLKPANIGMTADGTVKVLDFGLAKFGSGPGDAGGAALEMTQSPTLTFAGTQAGVILGTAAYMAPEQAKGRPADKRSDVWAFGCVLFELLAGKSVFGGEDVSDTLAFVLTRDPDWTALPAGVPPSIHTLLRRCLEKDRRRRLPDIGVARLEIDDACARPGSDTAASQTNAAVSPRDRLPARAWWPAMTAGIGLAIGAVAVLALWAPWTPPAPRTPVRLSAELGAEVPLISAQGAAAGANAILSPDGAMLAFVGQSAIGRSQLFVRKLDELRAVPLSGTDRAGSPFFSPDGRWIGFFAENKLKKVAVAGGAVVTVADVTIGARGAWWAGDGAIVIAPDRLGIGLMRIPAAGGSPEPLTKLADGEVTHRWPQVLPGDKAVLYTAHSSPNGFDDAAVVVQALPAGRRAIVRQGGYYGRYLPSGHVVYIHDTTLFAIPFDLDRLEVAGEPVPVLEGMEPNPVNGGAHVAASNNGTLVYVPTQLAAVDSPIQWLTRDGRMTPLRPTPANWTNLALAPDGQRVALAINDGKQFDVFVYDWTRDTLSRLTFDALDDVIPAWTPDGRRIVFSSRRGDKSTFNLWWQRADGTGEAQRLTESASTQAAPSWHPSGRLLAFTESHSPTLQDIMILPIEGDEASGWKPGKPRAFLNGPVGESQPAFSPDGKWLAYAANEAGRSEVFVRPFPGPGGKWQISSDGGRHPTWSRTRKELLFASTPPDNRIMVAAYETDGDTFRARKPVVWSETRFVNRIGLGAVNRSFDLHPDGDRVAVATAPATDGGVRQDKVLFIFNFFDELRRIAPRKR